MQRRRYRVGKHLPRRGHHSEPLSAHEEQDAGDATVDHPQQREQIGEVQRPEPRRKSGGDGSGGPGIPGCTQADATCGNSAHGSPVQQIAAPLLAGELG